MIRSRKYLCLAPELILAAPVPPLTKHTSLLEIAFMIQCHMASWGHEYSAALCTRILEEKRIDENKHRKPSSFVNQSSPREAEPCALHKEQLADTETQGTRKRSAGTDPAREGTCANPTRRVRRSKSPAPWQGVPATFATQQSWELRGQQAPVLPGVLEVQFPFLGLYLL